MSWTKAAAQPATLVFGADSKVVDPASVAVIAGHGRPDHTLPVMCHYDELGLHEELPLYILSRILPRAHKAITLQSSNTESSSSLMKLRKVTASIKRREVATPLSITTSHCKTRQAALHKRVSLAFDREP
jgi:hypothetical protein